MIKKHRPDWEEAIMNRTQPRRKEPVAFSCLLAASVAMLPLETACAGDLALGEYLSSECVTCHQLSGHAAGSIPPIVGLPEDYFLEALEAYKTGERDNEVMRNIAGGLTAEDMSALATYFANQGQD
jgi:cytochrome c